MPTVVSREVGKVELEELALRSTSANDVVVQVDASGICHSDIAVLTGELPGRLPVALGHEGAGTVLEVGAAVTTTKPGDRVVLAAIAPCGRCWFCSRSEFNLCTEAMRISPPPFLDGTTPVRGASGLGTFTDTIVVDERVAVRVDTSLPAEQLALIGCAVLTGAGSIFNIAKVETGSAVMVVGAGGIGLAAIQAARASGAYPIAAIDPSPEARAAAVGSGATVAVSPDEVASLLEFTDGRGYDVVVECVGVSATFEMVWPLARRGGHIVLVGVAPQDQYFPVPVIDVVLSGRHISGCVYGSSSVHRDIPRYVAMAEHGSLDLDALVGRTIGLEDSPAALLANAPGPGRTVIVRS